MSDTSSALFQQMKLTILLTAKDGVEESPFQPAYLQAWDDGVYPLLNDGVSWHQPHKDQFPITEEMVERLHSILCKHWDNKTGLTFYKLEDDLDIHGPSTALGEFTRSEVIRICRYFYLHDIFDQRFWATLCTNRECPSEAHSIASDKQVDIYFN
ncbi:MAG: hypothetical protein JJT87_19520 [Halomonas sp.]|nr:hypothetical protein [Halomonas sp.]MCC5904107.1 hypothetical protein [Halomonas sp.]